MPKDMSVSDQQRKCMGNHTNWLDNREGGQRLQNQRVLNLSRYAGDAVKKNHAQTLLQLFMLISLIQNSNATPVFRRSQQETEEYGLASNEQTALDYQKNFYPEQQLTSPLPVPQVEYATVKRHIERNDNRAFSEPPVTNGKPKLFILVKADFCKDIDDDIYKLALKKTMPEEIAAVRRAIKQNHLKDHWAFATDETDSLVEMFEKYVIYKAALDSLEHSLTKKKVRTLLFDKSSELYGLAGDSKEIEDKRLALKVQLYHLDKLAQDDFDIDYHPFSLTPNPKNDAESHYEDVEAELAGQLIEKAIQSSGEIPERFSITYGPSYQARKSFIAYALHVYGIYSQDQFAKELYKDTHFFYKQLLNTLENYMLNEDEMLLDEIANHFYFSLFNHYMANPDAHLAISRHEDKRMGEFTQKDKVDALIYNFNRDIEVRYRPKKNMKELVLLVAQEFLFSGRLGKIGLPKRSHLSRSKIKGGGVKSKSSHIKVPLPNSFAHKKTQLNQKALPQKVKKPHRQDYSDEDAYLQARQEYESYLKQRVALRKNPDHDRRRRIAVEKIRQLEKNHQQKISQESASGFTLTSAQGDRAGTVVLSAHAWSDNYTNLLGSTRGKKLFFLGPDGKVLLEAPEKQGLLPTSNLVAGDKHPEIFSTFTNEGVKVLANRGGHSADFEQVKNYRLKHYEATPDEEIKLAVMQNRIKADSTKMDFLTVDEMAGEKKLTDVLNLMKKDKLLQDYDKVIFYACREIKRPGTMKSETGLRGAYEINFVDDPIPVQVRMKRSLTNNDAAEEPIKFDGYYAYERFEIEGDEVTPYLEGIVPYLND